MSVQRQGNGWKEEFKGCPVALQHGHLVHFYKMQTRPSPAGCQVVETPHQLICGISQVGTLKFENCAARKLCPQSCIEIGGSRRSLRLKERMLVLKSEPLLTFLRLYLLVNKMGLIIHILEG